MEKEEVRKLIEEDQVARMQAVNDGLRELLEKYNCRLDFSMLLTSDGKILPDIKIIPN